MLMECPNHMQAPALQEMEAQLLALQVCAEGARRRTAATGSQYRVFLTWLIRVWQQLMRASDSCGPRGALLQPHAAVTVLGFLEGQLLDDCVGAWVFGKVSCPVLVVMGLLVPG